METAACGNMLVNELTQGQGLARELESQLDSASIDLCKSLAQDILASIEKAISMAKSSLCSSAAYTDGSPRSETSEPPFIRLPDRKKRKTQPKCASQVKLGSGPEAEGPLDDGYSWRKYGQKEILGAKHPRGYYRCTHRNTQGCPAMRQVQRSEDNPAIFEVTYRGTHTCHPRSSGSPSPPSAAAPSSPFSNLNYHRGDENNSQLLLSFQNTLKVETDGLQDQYSNYHKAPPSSPFSFPSTPADGTNHDGHVFSPGSTLEGCCFKRSYADAFISPDNTLESDFNDMITAVTSSTNSCMLDLDFLLQPPSSELDADFRFDAASFFS